MDKPLSIVVVPLEDADGTLIRCGVRPPSCSGQGAAQRYSRAERSCSRESNSRVEHSHSRAELQI